MAKGIKIVGRRALIGRGFVGQNLNKPGRFTDFYHSKNVHEMSGHYDLIVCAAPTARKYWANQFPQLDWDNIEKLVHVLEGVTTDRFVILAVLSSIT